MPATDEQPETLYETWAPLGTGRPWKRVGAASGYFVARLLAEDHPGALILPVRPEFVRARAAGSLTGSDDPGTDEGSSRV